MKVFKPTNCLGHEVDKMKAQFRQHFGFTPDEELPYPLAFSQDENWNHIVKMPENDEEHKALWRPQYLYNN